jgi:hypothetical protein
MLMVRPLDDTIPDPVARLPASVAKLDREDLPAYRAFRPRADHEAVRARLDRGEVCFVSWLDGRIVQAAWGATGRARSAYLGRDLLLEPDTAYVYDSFTLPVYRRNRLAAGATAELMRHYRQRGFRRLVSLVAVENTAGLQLNLKRGSRAVGRFTCLRLGRWRRHRQTFWGEQPLRVVAPGEAIGETRRQ